MSSTRSFTVEIGGREIKEDVIADEKKAIYRANVDALTYFHSEVESQFNVVVTIDDLHTFFPGLNLGTRTMDLILQKNAPYAETYYIYDMYHDQSFFSREEYRIYRRYMDVYNKQRQLYTQKIPEFDIYLQKKHETRVIGWERNGFFRRNPPGSRISFIQKKRTYGGKSKKHRNSKKHRKSNKRK